MNVSNLTDLFCQFAKLTTEGCLGTMIDLLRELGYSIDADSKGNYAICTPPKPSPVALVAHCDTVAPKPPTHFTNRCGIVSVRDKGILGADDRAGIAAIAAIVIAGQRPQVYLTTGEERMGIGASVLAYETEYAPPDTLHVMLQLDRQDSNDFVTYDCDSPQLNKWCRKFGWKEDRGSFSDISILAPAWGIAAANLSVGYYGQHTSQETLIVPQLLHTIERVQTMIGRPPANAIDYVEAYRAPKATSSFSYTRPLKYQPATNTPNLWQPVAEKEYDDFLLGLDDGTEYRSAIVLCEVCQQSVDVAEINGKGWCDDCQCDFDLSEGYKLAMESDK